MGRCRRSNKISGILADEAFTDLLLKHGRPTDLKSALHQSVAGMDKRPPAASVNERRGKDVSQRQRVISDVGSDRRITWWASAS
jgi:hypothetical protein